MAQRQGLTDKAKSQARGAAQSAKDTAKQNNLIADLFEANEALVRSGVDIPKLLGTCLLASVTFGFAFQVTHNNGLLPVSPHKLRRCSAQSDQISKGHRKCAPPV